MDSIYEIGASGMFQGLERLEVISRNIANLSTPGYRQEIPVTEGFAGHLRGAETLGTGGSASHAIHLDTDPGTTRKTDNPLDVALQGAGYFQVETPDGPRYTRAGRFHVDARGRLVDVHGYPVVNEGGGAVRLAGKEPEIDANGVIREGGRIVDELKVVEADDRALARDGEGLLQMPGPAPAPMTRDAISLRQGFLEGSNVDRMAQMTGMLETVRGIETSQRVIRGYDEVLSMAVQTLGEF